MNFFKRENKEVTESQPIIKRYAMYVTASYSRVLLLILQRVKRFWQYDANFLMAILPCCDVINRGAAIYDNLIIFGTLDAKLVALG